MLTLVSFRGSETLLKLSILVALECEVAVEGTVANSDLSRVSVERYQNKKIVNYFKGTEIYTR